MLKPSSLFRPLAARCGRRDFLRGLLLGGGALAGMTLLPGQVRALAQPDAVPYARTELFMGTFVRVQIAGCTQAQASEAAERALTLGRRLASLYDRHDGGSPLSVLNGQGTLDAAPAELCSLLELAADIHARTPQFDVSVLPLLQWRQAAQDDRWASSCWRCAAVISPSTAALIRAAYSSQWDMQNSPPFQRQTHNFPRRRPGPRGGREGAATGTEIPLAPRAGSGALPALIRR